MKLVTGDDLFSIGSRIVAILVLIMGAFQLAMGVSIAAGWIGPYEAALARYTGADTSGEVIDRGIYAMVFALALGTLAEIGIAVRKLAAR